MPIESTGIDSKMSVDTDPKTYSPMSCSDENMSSPPSVLTTASAGSCTPSSLPSAGSTPSSIQSAGSTPYQFVTQEESSAIKLDTSDRNITSEHQPVLPCSPEPPYQSESLEPATPELQKVIPNNENLDQNSSKSPIPITKADSYHTTGSLGSDLSEEFSERRENCSCIMCDDKITNSTLECRIDDDVSYEKEYSAPSTIKKVRNRSKSRSSSETKIHKKNHQNSKKKILYESEISADPQSTSIKIKIKFTSCTKPSSQSVSPPYNSSLPLPNVNNSQVVTSTSLPMIRGKKKRSSRRGSGVKRKIEATESSDGRKRRKPIKQSPEWGPVIPKVNDEPQSPWGCKLPKEILQIIFKKATYSEGCIPFLLRVSRVCRLWREAASDPCLWHTVDLSGDVVKSRYRTERKLFWILENRLSKVEELNLAGWTEAVSPFILDKIGTLCPNLVSITLSYCFKLHAENISQYFAPCSNLRRIDLTNIMGAHKPTPRCAVGQQTLTELATFMKERFTHLVVASNTLSNLPVIISSLSKYCINLQVLDLSSVETVGRDSVRIDLEKLQTGCPKLRVLRLANSLFRLCSISMADQVLSPGFPELEELSLAVEDKVNIGMNDDELERILKNSNKLRLLDVRGCHNITVSSLVRIPPWDIEHLFLAGGSTLRCYSDRLELVIKKWHHSLVELDLSWTTGIADSIDSAILTLCEEKNERLKVLNLCGSSATFKPIRRLLSQCLSLQYLNLTSCRALPRGLKRAYCSSADIEKLAEDITGGRFDEPLDSADN